jgi:hypothetical protein
VVGRRAGRVRPDHRPDRLFTAGAVPIALVEREELGRRLATFAPDGDLV